MLTSQIAVNMLKATKNVKICAAKKLKKLKDKRHKHYSKDVVVTGTQYTGGRFTCE